MCRGSTIIGQCVLASHWSDGYYLSTLCFDATHSLIVMVTTRSTLYLDGYDTVDTIFGWLRHCRHSVLSAYDTIDTLIRWQYVDTPFRIFATLLVSVLTTVFIACSISALIDPLAPALALTLTLDRPVAIYILARFADPRLEAIECHWFSIADPEQRDFCVLLLCCAECFACWMEPRP